MAQKRSGTSKGSGTTKSGAGSRSGSKAKASTSRAKSASSRSTTTAKSSSTRSATTAKSSSSRSASSRKAAASKGGNARPRQQKPTNPASGTPKTPARPPPRAGVEAPTVAELREALRKNLIGPLEMVMISRERIEEVLGEAVDQGRVTVRDAQRISSGLVKRGQRQTSDVLKDLENLLGRGRSEIGGRASGARGSAVRRASPALAQVDRVRRGAGVGPNFPITGYDDLTATQIQSRLGSLTPAELRKVRDHERRNDGRKTVLASIESKLT